MFSRSFLHRAVIPVVNLGSTCYSISAVFAYHHHHHHHHRHEDPHQARQRRRITLTMSFQCTIEAIRASCLHPQVQHVPWGTIPDIEDQRTWRIVSKAARKKWDHTQEDPLTKRMSWIGDAVMYVLATAVIDMRYGLMDRQTKSVSFWSHLSCETFGREG